MADFFKILDEAAPGTGVAVCPFAAQIDSKWVEGVISIEFLNANYGQYSTATEMKAATNSLGLQMFFDWLAQQGKIPSREI